MVSHQQRVQHRMLDKRDTWRDQKSLDRKVCFDVTGHKSWKRSTTQTYRRVDEASDLSCYSEGEPDKRRKYLAISMYRTCWE